MYIYEKIWLTICLSPFWQSQLITTDWVAYKQQKFIFTILEPEIWNQVVGRAAVPMNALGENSYWPLLLQIAPDILWLVAALLQSLLLSSHSLLLFPMWLSSVSFIRTLFFGLSTHLDNPEWSHLKILNLIILIRHPPPDNLILLPCQ